MAASPDTIVEIPPPEVAPTETRWWGLAIVLIATMVGLMVFVSITEPRVAPIDWIGGEGPMGSVNLDSLVATADGFAVLSGMTTDGVLLWSSRDGVTWRSQSLQDAPSQLALVGEGLIAYGVRVGRTVMPDGDDWLEGEENIVFPDDVRSRQGSGRPNLVSAESGFIIMSISGDVWWSSHGRGFAIRLGMPATNHDLTECAAYGRDRLRAGRVHLEQPGGALRDMAGVRAAGLVLR
jgi:hypothetical protein